MADEARTVPPGTLPSRATDALAKPWVLVSQNAPLALAMVGLFLYGVVWTAYAIFYRAFGLTPRLGATTETTVLWTFESDTRNGRVVRVPKRSTVIDGRSRNCAGRR